MQEAPPLLHPPPPCRPPPLLFEPHPPCVRQLHSWKVWREQVLSTLVTLPAMHPKPRCCGSYRNVWHSPVSDSLSPLLFLLFSFNLDRKISHSPPPSFLCQPCFIAEREPCICAPSTVSNLLCLFHKSELKVVLRGGTASCLFVFGVLCMSVRGWLCLYVDQLSVFVQRHCCRPSWVVVRRCMHKLFWAQLWCYRCCFLMQCFSVPSKGQVEM